MITPLDHLNIRTGLKWCGFNCKFQQTSMPQPKLTLTLLKQRLTKDHYWNRGSARAGITRSNMSAAHKRLAYVIAARHFAKSPSHPMVSNGPILTQRGWVKEIKPGDRIVRRCPDSQVQPANLTTTDLIYVINRLVADGRVTLDKVMQLAKNRARIEEIETELDLLRSGLV